MAVSLKKKISVFAAANAAVQALTLGHALAAPSDKEAWRSDEYGIVVYKDEKDADTFWYIPKIRFEATSDSKTLLRSKKLDNGNTEYTVRIIPYFPKELKELAARNIPGLRDESQLKPVIAKSVGISLPDFGYKYVSANVTNFTYLDAPRLLRFNLGADDAATFDELYADPTGVNVDYTLTYDGVMTDKFYDISVSCKDIATELAVDVLPGSGVSVSAPVNGVSVVAGVDIETAFLNSVNNSSKNVSIVSKGDVTGMQEMIRRVVNLCFDPADGTTTDDSSRYNDRRTTDNSTTDNTTPNRNGTQTTTPSSSDGTANPRRGDVIDPGFVPRTNVIMQRILNSSVLDDRMLSQALREEAFLHNLNASMLLDKDVGTDGSDDSVVPDARQSAGGLLPQVTANAKFRIKKTMMNDDKQAVVQHVSLKDTTSIVVIPGYLTAAAKKVETVQVQSIEEKTFLATAANTAAAPLKTGMKVASGEQWTINAAFVFNSKSSYSMGKTKQYAWDASWAKTDGDLYYRIGSGSWTPVKGHSIIESDTIAGGELQLYIDKSAIFGKIPEKMRKAGCLGLCEPMFRIESIAPEYSIQVSGRRIDVK